MSTGWRTASPPPTPPHSIEEEFIQKRRQRLSLILEDKDKLKIWVQFSLIFNSSWWKIASAARNFINYVPQAAAMTFAFFLYLSFFYADHKNMFCVKWTRFVVVFLGDEFCGDGNHSPACPDLVADFIPPALEVLSQVYLAHVHAAHVTLRAHTFTLLTCTLPTCTLHMCPLHTCILHTCILYTCKLNTCTMYILHVHAAHVHSFKTDIFLLFVLWKLNYLNYENSKR